MLRVERRPAQPERPLDALPVPGAVFGADGRLLAANAAFRSLATPTLGGAPTLASLFGAKTKVAELLERAKKAPPVERRVRLVGEDGVTRSFLASVSPTGKRRAPARYLLLLAPGAREGPPERQEALRGYGAVPDERSARDLGIAVVSACDAIGVGMAITVVKEDGARVLAFLNGAGRRILGLPDADVATAAPFPYLDRPVDEVLHQAGRGQGDGWEAVSRIETADGLRIVKAGLSFGDYRGRPAVFALFEDVTEPVKNLELVTKSAGRLDRLARHAPVALFETDAKGKITFLIGQVGDALDPLRGATGKRPAAGQVARLPGLPEAVAAALRGTPVTFGARLAERMFEVAIAPETDGHGTTRGTLGVVTDMTEAVNLESQRRTVDAKARILNRVGHSLNTPLTPIMLHIDRLRRRSVSAGDAELARIVASLERNFARLNRGIRVLLDVADERPEGLALHLEPIDMGAFVRTGAQEAAAAAKKRGVRIVIGPLWTGRVQGDRQRLATALHELLENAIAASPENGTVALRVKAKGGRWTLEVVDDGPGPPAESAQANAFQESVALTGSIPLDGRLGLGLLAARAAALAHGGTLTLLARTTGTGTIARLHLPKKAGKA